MEELKKQIISRWMDVRVVVTLIVLGSALYIILSQNYGEADQKWAYGSVRIILGYWLKH